MRGGDVSRGCRTSMTTLLYALTRLLRRSSWRSVNHVWYGIRHKSDSASLCALYHE